MISPHHTVISTHPALIKPTYHVIQIPASQSSNTSSSSSFSSTISSSLSSSPTSSTSSPSFSLSSTSSSSSRDSFNNAFHEKEEKINFEELFSSKKDCFSLFIDSTFFTPFTILFNFNFFTLFSNFKSIFLTFLTILTVLTILIFSNFSSVINDNNHGFEKLASSAEIKKQESFLKRRTDDCSNKKKGIPEFFFSIDRKSYNTCIIIVQHQNCYMPDISNRFAYFGLTSSSKSNVSVSETSNFFDENSIKTLLNFDQANFKNVFKNQWHQKSFQKESNIYCVSFNISYKDFSFFFFLIFFFSKSKEKKKRNFSFCFLFICLLLLNLISSHLSFLKIHSTLLRCDKTVFFSTETLNVMNKVNNDFHFRNQRLFLIGLSRNRFNHQSITLRYSTFLKLLLILSGSVELNPGPNQNIQNLNQWGVFSKRGLHLLHLNINSLLPKIDELRSIAKQSNAAVIGITESKLDSSVCDSEISIDGYDVIRYDRNRRGGGVSCFVKSTICFNQKFLFQDDIENIVIDLLFPNTKPITVGIFYRPPDQRNFIESISHDLPSLKLESNEVYILGDFNFNLYHNEKYIFKNFSNSTTSVNPEIKNYIEFCSLFGLEQMVQTPTRITCNSSSLIDHILTNFSDRISQSGIVDTGISDHQLIFCTRKITKIKVNGHRQIAFRSLENYSEKSFVQELEKINFPDYEVFYDIDAAYNDFFSKLSKVINKMAPEKTKRVKSDTQEWFDGEIVGAMYERDKLLKKFKASKLHVDKINYNISRISVQNLIKKKKEEFLGSKLEESRNKPKELWTSLKSLGMPNKKKCSSNICLEQNGDTFFEASKLAEIFGIFFLI